MEDVTPTQLQKRGRKTMSLSSRIVGISIYIYEHVIARSWKAMPKTSQKPGFACFVFPHIPGKVWEAEEQQVDFFSHVSC